MTAAGSSRCWRCGPRRGRCARAGAPGRDEQHREPAGPPSRGASGRPSPRRSAPPRARTGGLGDWVVALAMTARPGLEQALVRARLRQHHDRRRGIRRRPSARTGRGSRGEPIRRAAALPTIANRAAESRCTSRERHDGAAACGRPARPARSTRACRSCCRSRRAASGTAWPGSSSRASSCRRSRTAVKATADHDHGRARPSLAAWARPRAATSRRARRRTPGTARRRRCGRRLGGARRR